MEWKLAGEMKDFRHFFYSLFFINFMMNLISAKYLVDPVRDVVLGRLETMRNKNEVSDQSSIEPTSVENTETSQFSLFDSILTNGLLTASSKREEKINMLTEDESNLESTETEMCTDLQVALLHESQRSFSNCIDSVAGKNDESITVTSKPSHKYFLRKLQKKIQVQTQNWSKSFEKNTMNELTNCLIDDNKALVSCLQTHIPSSYSDENREKSMEDASKGSKLSSEVDYDSPAKKPKNMLAQYCMCFESVTSSTAIANSLQSATTSCKKIESWNEDIATAMNLCHSTNDFFTNLQALGESLTRDIPLLPSPFEKKGEEKPHLFPFAGQGIITKPIGSSDTLEATVDHEDTSTQSDVEIDPPLHKNSKERENPPHNPHPLRSSYQTQYPRNQKGRPNKNSRHSDELRTSPMPVKIHDEGQPVRGREDSFFENEGGAGFSEERPPLPPLMLFGGGFIVLVAIMTLVAFYAYKRGQASSSNGQGGRRESRYAQVVTTADGEYGGDSFIEEEEERNARIISNIHNFVIDDDDLDEEEILDGVNDIPGSQFVEREANIENNTDINERSSSTSHSNLSQVELTAMPTATAVPLV